MTRRTVALAVVAMVTAAGFVSGGPATAGDAGNSQEVQDVQRVSDPAALAIAKERGISLGEAERRIGWQQKADELEPQLVSALGGAGFGGLWIGRDDDRLKVGIVSGASVTTAATTRTVGTVAAAHGVADAIDTVLVPHSLAALESANSWLSEQLVRVNAGAPWPLRTGYLPDKSVVRIGLPVRSQELTPGQSAVVDEAKRRFGSMLMTYTYTGTGRVTPEVCRFPYCDAPLRAGIRLNPVACTLGFLARSRSDNALYAFTAGHCLDGSRSTVYSTHLSDGTSYRIGSYHNHELGTKGDAGIIRVTEPGWNARAWVLVMPSADRAGEQGTAYDPEYPIWGDGGSRVNMRVCKSGMSADRTSCGKVEELGVPIEYPDGTKVLGTAKASYCSRGGDSGGPVYSGHVAYGIHIAGDGDQVCIAYYQGIRAAEDLMRVDVSFDAR